MIIGGPPCQAYSVAGRVRDENGMRDDYRNYLFEHYLNVVNRYRPKAFVFENVPGILSAAPNGKPITDLIRKGFRDAAMRSIGLKAGLTEAWMEIQDLIEDYELQTKRFEWVNDLIKELCQQIRYADKLLEIKGIGITTVAGFIAEVGDIMRFDSTKELQKLVGLELVADSSG